MILCRNYFYNLCYSFFCFQVNCQDLKTVAKLIKEEMETALELKVVFPVKLKVGKRWGTLVDYNFNE